MQNTALSTSLNASLAKIVSAIVVPIVEFGFVLAVLLFIWGIASMIIHGNDAEKRKEGAQSMLWGTVGMFIMIGVYGIIRLIANTLSPLGVTSPF